MKGTVKWFNDHKGFGFIAADDGQDYFAHYTSVMTTGYKTLKEGAAVEFDLAGTIGPKKVLTATNIREVA